MKRLPVLNKKHLKIKIIVTVNWTQPFSITKLEKKTKSKNNFLNVNKTTGKWYCTFKLFIFQYICVQFTASFYLVYSTVEPI